MTASLSAEYFESLYTADKDPWQFATSSYEAAKYQATLAALPQPRYRSAFEVGCSIGILTRALAARCERLLAVDIAAAALAQAEANCAACGNVTFRQMQIPQSWPEGRFNLTLFSEVLYYLSPADIAATAAASMSTRAKGGVFLLVHWIGETNYPCSGDDACSMFIAASGLKSLTASRTEHYRLDLLG